MSARRSPWGGLMDCSRETWDATDHPQTQTIYYCGLSDGSHPIAPNVFYSATLSEDLGYLSARTIEAFEHALSIPGWDFLARPNSSCYVHKSNLVRHCEGLPSTGVIRGAWTGDYLWGGCQFILSRDVVQAMVETKDSWRNDLMDDQAITRSVQAIGVNIRQGCVACSVDDNHDGSFTCMCYGGSQEAFRFTDFSELRKAGEHFFFRVKQDHDRSLDLGVMREVHRYLK